MQRWSKSSNTSKFDLNQSKGDHHVPMEHSLSRQTFEFGKSISTAGKSILNFIQLSSFVGKHCKMWKILSYKAFELCIRTEKRYQLCGNAFSRVKQKYRKFRNLTLLYLTFFNILQPNFTISLNLESSFQLC